MTSQRLMVLDTASMYFRAFYGVPDSFRAPDGTPVILPPARHDRGDPAR